MIRKQEAEALREYFENTAALYDSVAASLTTEALVELAEGERDDAYLRAREYDRLARSWVRRLFASAPR